MDSTGSRLRGTVHAVVESIPWRSVAADLAVVVAWFVAVSFVFAAAGWPTWLYYLAVVGGAVGYSLASGSTARAGA